MERLIKPNEMNLIKYLETVEDVLAFSNFKGFDKRESRKVIGITAIFVR